MITTEITIETKDTDTGRSVKKVLIDAELLDNVIGADRVIELIKKDQLSKLAEKQAKLQPMEIENGRHIKINPVEKSSFSTLDSFILSMSTPEPRKFNLEPKTFFSFDVLSALVNEQKPVLIYGVKCIIYKFRSGRHDVEFIAVEHFSAERAGYVS